MSDFFISAFAKCSIAVLLAFVAGGSASSRAQTINESTPHETHLTAPTLNIPPHLSTRLTSRQQELLKKATPEELKTLQTVVLPRDSEAV
jgi:hypothetical protein